MELGILKLPETFTIKADNLFIVYIPISNSRYVTQKISFQNLLFGLDNVTFSSTVTNHTTQINSLSTTLDNLSSQVFTSFDSLCAYLVTLTDRLFTNLNYTLNPVGCVRYTSENVSPGLSIPGTSWVLISQGSFIAGVGSNKDKNSNLFIVNTANTSPVSGEYNNTLTVFNLPPHNHKATLFGETSTSVAGSFIESADGPGATLAGIVSQNTGGNQSHNNTPPFYGVYIWRRTA
jgi:hypothetical protein